MSKFCGNSGSVPSMTPDEMRATYPNGVLPSALPDMSNGLASDNWVQTYVKQLETNGKLPKPTDMSKVNSAMFKSPESNDPLASYVAADNKFQDGIKSEYCFYESRYFSSLDSFLQAVANSSLGNSDSTSVQLKLDQTRVLNQKLTLLTQIVNGVSKYRYQTAQGYNSEINAVNNELRQRQRNLLEQNEILRKESASADLNKRMVEYTTEKNKANHNLLSLYGVLNIVALAMIFYIART
jgi:hypothetical protein